MNARYATNQAKLSHPNKNERQVKLHTRNNKKSSSTTIPASVHWNDVCCCYLPVFQQASTTCAWGTALCCDLGVCFASTVFLWTSPQPNHVWRIVFWVQMMSRGQFASHISILLSLSLSFSLFPLAPSHTLSFSSLQLFVPFPTMFLVGCGIGMCFGSLRPHADSC